jgi:hypothetical protein
MKLRVLAGTALLVAAAMPLAAQAAPNFGLAINLAVPTGGFSSTTYADGSKETYDTTVGAQFTASFPVDRNLALRFNVSGQNFSGDWRPAGDQSMNTEDSFWSIGGEAQMFLGNGNAMRHLGAYLIGGVSVDFERFSFSVDDPSFYGNDTWGAVNKTRLGGTVGMGYSWRTVGRWRWTMEGVYHGTLSNHNTDAGDPPAADFVKFSFGMIF